MVAYLMTKLTEWIEQADKDRREEYVAMARDLAEIERRMIHLETTS